MAQALLDLWAHSIKASMPDAWHCTVLHSFLVLSSRCLALLHTHPPFQQPAAWTSLSCRSCYVFKGTRTWKIKIFTVRIDSRWLLHLYLLCTAKYPTALASFTSPFSGRSLSGLFNIICCTCDPKKGKYVFPGETKTYNAHGKTRSSPSMNSNFFLSSLHFLQLEQWN